MFRRTTHQITQTPTEYPNGSFIETEKGYFFILAPGKRLRIITGRVLNSWAPQRVVRTTEAAVAKYRVSSKLKFRNGSLIHNLADAKIYLIEDGKRRHITNPDVIKRIGAVRKEIVTVSLSEVNLHDEGEPLD